ncbi:MAG: hypothetical protein AAGI45_05330 [Cyanobacteria bacterium P01_H01_bin.26]
MVEPDGPNWLKTAFPDLTASFEAAPQTAAEIEAEMKSRGITSGQPIPWPRADRPTAWFYPILGTDGLQEIWIYRVRGNQLQQVDQVAIRPIQDSFITTPLIGTASQVASVDSDAPLSSVQIMSGKAIADSPWLRLWGQRRYGNTVMHYGQILTYQPRTQRLHQLLNWSSPVGQQPQWQSGDEQLTIDQTVGLRPSFLLYQFLPNDPPQLREISLYRSVYGTELATSLYNKALSLAQGAVWSHSLQMMQSAKMELGSDWSPEAQAQLDLIRLHAAQTKAQTERTWSSQQQHILAYLIDGQWEQALNILETNPAIYDSMLKRLEQNFDALWRGVTVHLKVHPQDSSPQIWGALLVTARQSPEAGQDWLQKQTRVKTTLERLQAVGQTDGDPAPGNAASTTANGTPEVLPTAAGSGRYRRLVGQASAVDTPGGGWLRSQTLPTPSPGQTWYHIQVELIQDGSGWKQPPITMAPATFWAESSSLRQQLQLFSGNRPTAGITVYGIKTTGASITLLALGQTVAGPALTATHDSLRWLSTLPWQTAVLPSRTLDGASTNDGSNDGSTVSTPTTLPAEVEPTLTALMSDTIGRQLGLTPEQTAQLYPHLQYASLNLTGDAAPEHLFHTGLSLPPELTPTPARTMIFSSTGALLYSDVNQPQTLLALTASSNAQSVRLLIEQAGRYGLIDL